MVTTNDRTQQAPAAVTMAESETTNGGDAPKPEEVTAPASTTEDDAPKSEGKGG